MYKRIIKFTQFLLNSDNTLCMSNDLLDFYFSIINSIHYGMMRHNHLNERSHNFIYIYPFEGKLVKKSLSFENSGMRKKSCYVVVCVGIFFTEC